MRIIFFKNLPFLAKRNLHYHKSCNSLISNFFLKLMSKALYFLIYYRIYFCKQAIIPRKLLLTIEDFGTYTDGDVLLNGGTIVPYNENSLTFIDEQKAKAVGVLYCDDYGVPKGYFGIHNSYDGTNSGTYACASSSSNGENTMFTDLVCSTLIHKISRNNIKCAHFPYFYVIIFICLKEKIRDI